MAMASAARLGKSNITEDDNSYILPIYFTIYQCSNEPTKTSNIAQIAQIAVIAFTYLLNVISLHGMR